jgi:molecular chaperone GrpE
MVQAHDRHAETEHPAMAEGGLNDPGMPAQDLAAAYDAAQRSWEAERAELKDRLMRALAEMENSRKRAEKDRRDAALYGGAKLARDLLPVFDYLSRALGTVDEAARAQLQGMVDGVDLTLRELTKVLERHGVELISPEPGTPFDPHMHEAIFEAPVPGFAPGSVIQVAADGFRMHDQLLRPAKVGVASRAVG